jgi:hypothetical protein
LNVSGLEVGEWYNLYWYLDQDNDVWGFNATDEYEHFWWDIEVDEYMCGLHMDVELVGMDMVIGTTLASVVNVKNQYQIILLNYIMTMEQGL